MRKFKYFPTTVNQFENATLLCTCDSTQVFDVRHDVSPFLPPSRGHVLLQCRQPQVDLLLLLRGGLQLVQPDRPVSLAQRVLRDAPEMLFMFSDPCAFITAVWS